MFKGFYDVTSGMLSQTRKLDVISNNMGNISTPGYKSSTYLDTTFGEMMFHRIGNRDKTNARPIGPQTMAVVPSIVSTDFTQGAIEETGQALDFAIEGNGFFQVQMDGQNYLTRNGSFIIDDAGYLALSSHGRVLGADGQPIRLGTDQITADVDGNLFRPDGTRAGQIGVFDVAGADQDVLQKEGEGIYRAQGQVQAANGAQVQWKALEHSNVDVIREMTRMMSSQRAVQSASQMLKIYDQVMTKAVSEIGRV